MISPVTQSPRPETDAADPTTHMITPDDESRRSSLRGSMLVVIVMAGWMGLVFMLAILVGRNDPNVEVPVEVALGVVVTPADGWYTAEDVWDVGASGVALQKSGVYAAFWVEEYGGGSEELLALVLEDIRSQYEGFRLVSEWAVTVAGDLPGSAAEFSGSWDWGRVEGQVAVVVHKGVSVVMWAETYSGQLIWVQGDINWMLANLEIPR